MTKSGISRCPLCGRGGRVGDNGSDKEGGVWVPWMVAVPECTELTLLDPIVVVDVPAGPLLYELPLSRRKCGAKCTAAGSDGATRDLPMLLEVN